MEQLTESHVGAWRVALVAAGADAIDARVVSTVLDAEAGTARIVETPDVAAAAASDAELVVLADPATPAEVGMLAAAPARPRIVLVVDQVTSVSTRRLLEAGADAIVLREDVRSALGPICRAVLSGQVCVPRAARSCVEPPALSLRERQVLALMAAGRSTAEIAGELFLAPNTVKSHIASAFRRLGVNSRREAVALVLGSDEALRRIVLTSQPRPQARAGVEAEH